MNGIAWRQSRRRTRWPLALTGLLILATAAGGSTTACAGGGDPGSEAAGSATAELSPEELGRLGGRIHAEPERAGEILAEAGLSEQQLDARVREVTADPEAAQEYARGFREVAGEAPDGGG